MPINKIKSSNRGKAAIAAALIAAAAGGWHSYKDTSPKVLPPAVILASGPSLCAEDVNACQGQHVIAIKDAIQLAPWCDVLYGSGSDQSRWWPVNGDAVTVLGRLQYAVVRDDSTGDQKAVQRWTQVLRWDARTGLSDESDSLRGNNSLAHAIGLAVHLGVSRIVILGADMGHSPHGPKYFFGNRPVNGRSPFGQFLLCLHEMVIPLKSLGVEVINASRGGDLKCFPRRQLSEALA